MCIWLLNFSMTLWRIVNVKGNKNMVKEKSESHKLIQPMGWNDPFRNELLSPSIFSFCQFYRDYMIWMEPWSSRGLINSVCICEPRLMGGMSLSEALWCAEMPHQGSVWMSCLFDCSWDSLYHEPCFHNYCHHCIITNIINNRPPFL